MSVRRRLLVGLAPSLLLCVLACGLSFASAPAMAAGACPNEQIREEQGSTLLPDCRAYEMISPPYKGGFGATKIQGVSPDGESVAFFSAGAFGGAPSGFTPVDYVTFRGSSGWLTSPEMAPAGVLPISDGLDMSSTLSEEVMLGEPGPATELASKKGSESEFVVHPTASPDVAADWLPAGPPLVDLVTPKEQASTYLGASADLCHLFVEPAMGVETQWLREPGLHPGSLHPYEVNRGCGGEPAALRFVGQNNKGKVLNPSCNETVGGATGLIVNGHKESTFNDIAERGGEVFFMAPVAGCTGGDQLFVRLGGERTLEVSRPLSPACGEVPCAGAESRAGAEFVGASRDGSRVFFRTVAPLTGEGEADELYMARIGCASGEGEACEPGETRGMKVTGLVRVSRDPHAGEASELRGVVNMAPDGSRVYFVAGGVLSQSPNVEGGMPLRGADNLYVYEPVPGHEGEDQTVFVADLCSGPEASGSVEDLRCPADLNEQVGGRNDRALWEVNGWWGGQTAGLGGGFLAFSTYAHLTGDDTALSAQVYRYDAQTGRLNRVSLGEDGYDADGNGPLNASIPNAVNQTSRVLEEYGMSDRAVSEDGSRILFRSAEPLSPRAINHLSNVYEWREGPGGGEGSVSLISSGDSTAPVEDAVISPEGRDIFFVTSQGLLPQDTDGAPDVYDARAGGGFPPAAAREEECSGDGCQGPLTNPAPLLIPGSVSQAPGGNFAPAVSTTTVNPKAKAKPVRCKKGLGKKKQRCAKSPKAKKSTHGKGSR